MSDARRCPACDREGCRLRYRVSHGSILECPGCGSAVTDDPRPDDGQRAIGQWYADRRLINRSYALPLSRLDSWLGHASFVSVIAERSDA
jgi:hypothetical protein